VIPDEELAGRIVDAVERNGPAFRGVRRLHAKGVCAHGVFTPTGAAAVLSRARYLSRDAVPALVRFSNGGSDPSAHDGARDGRGMATKLVGAHGAWDLVALSLPVFFVRTPEDFLAFVEARRPDPSTGTADPARIGAFLAEHPETIGALRHAMSAPPPASYATTRFHGIHAFVLVAPGGERRPFRYRWEPSAGVTTLEDAEALARPGGYLADELAHRLRVGHVDFALHLQLADPGDPTHDPTQPWGDGRAEVLAGHLRLTSLVEDPESGCEATIFDPTTLPEGIAPSDDPIPAVRSAAYSVSYARRRAER